MDRRLLNIILRQCFNTRLVAEARFAPTCEDLYVYPGNLDQQGFISYIQSQPIQEPPSLFGMHNNSSIKVSLGDSNFICNQIILLLPKNAGDGGQNPDDIIKNKTQEMFQMLQINLDYELALSKYPVNYF